jgi:hypothetical protein
MRVGLQGALLVVCLFQSIGSATGRKPNLFPATGRKYCTEGYHLKVGMYSKTDLAYGLFFYNNETQQYEGLAMDLLEQLSVEAGFTYEVEDVGPPGECTTAVKGPCPATFNELFDYMLTQYDVIGPWWTQSAARAFKNDFLPPFVDNSLALLTLQNTEEKKDVLNLLNFMAPFTYDTWILLTVACLVTGLTMSIFEECCVPGALTVRQFMKDLGSQEGFAEIEQHIEQHVKESLGALLGGNAEMTAVSTAGKCTSASFTFVILVVLAAYTANTAAFLTVLAQSKTTLIRDISDLETNAHLTACAFTKDGQVPFKVKERYPRIKTIAISGIIDENGNPDPVGIADMRHSLPFCNALFKFNFQVNSIKMDSTNCDVGRVGIKVLEPHAKGGGFAVPRYTAMRTQQQGVAAADRAECIREAMTGALSTVLDTPYIDELDQYYFAPAGCPIILAASLQSGLKPSAFAGLLLLHAVFMFVIGPALQWHEARKNRQKAHKQAKDLHVEKGIPKPTAHDLHNPTAHDQVESVLERIEVEELERYDSREGAKTTKPISIHGTRPGTGNALNTYIREVADNVVRQTDQDYARKLKKLQLQNLQAHLEQAMALLHVRSKGAS